MMKVIAAVLLASLHYTLADPPTSFRNGYKLTDGSLLTTPITKIRRKGKAEKN